MSAWPLALEWLRPQALWALLALPALAWAWQRGSDDRLWRGIVDPALQPHVLAGRGGRRRGLVAAWLAWTLACLALAGPSWRQAEAPLERPEAPLVVALDLSSRILAGDLAPDRLTRARHKLQQLLRARQGGQIGLVVYAADAHTVAPLTADAATVAAFGEALSPAIMPVDGQRPDLAIAHAARLLERAGFGHGDILLLSDRADARAEAAAAQARARGYRVSALGLGTARGAPLPTPEGGFRRDADGRPLFARLDAASLRALATAGGGVYREFRADEADLRGLGLLDSPAGAAVTAAEGVTRRVDDGPWLLLAVLPLALLALRRSGLVAVVLALALAGPPGPAWAIEPADLWQRREQRADAALRAGEYDQALRLARDPARRGAAAYRAGDYEAAIAAWSHLDEAAAHYNRGNALARIGDYAAAVEAYDRALELDPGLEDAAFNRDLVARAMQRAGAAGAGDDSSGDSAEGRAGPASPGPGEAGEREAGADGEAPEGEDGARAEDAAGDRGEDGEEAAGEAPDSGPEPDARRQAEAGQALSEAIDEALAREAAGAGDLPGTAGGEEAESGSSEEAMAEEERRQAVEQWLRRVPDDPGGLLRRKFAIEHARRQREGDE